MTGPSFTPILRDVQRLLRQRIGLAPDSLGTTAIESAMSWHAQALGGCSPERYLDLIRTDAEEFDELVERIVVPETWFFRDAASFECLRQYVRQRRAAISESMRPLRLLSIPCSTGEEVYSMAAVLMDEGLSSGQFQVLGVDISQRALRSARQGRYGANSFRQLGPAELELVDRYLRKGDGGREVVTELKRSVAFERGNLATDDFLMGQGPTDVIFCRNLLIYLDDAARRTALMHVRRLLAPGGLLYVGHSEAATLTQAAAGDSWCRFHPDFPFGLIPQPGNQSSYDAAVPPDSPSRHIRPNAEVAVPRVEWTTVDSRSAGWAVPLDRRSLSAVAPKPATTPTPAPTLLPPPRRPSVVSGEGTAGVSELLTEARAAADRGELESAATICQRLLDESDPRAEVYCLLGVVRQAAGQTGEAERLFAQALFLEPRNLEALTHLMVLKSSQGDEQAASNYRRRLASARQERI